MSEIVLQHQANPGALGANLTCFFVNVAGLPAFVGNDGVERTLVATSGNDLPVPGNLSVNGTATFNGSVRPDYNNTATVGNVTINKPAGRCIVAAGANQVVVTNNLCNAVSQVFASASQNDSTGRVTAATPANGSFTIHCVAPAANMQVNFIVFN